MAVTSGFFNSLYGDRKYNAEQFSAMFDNLITDGVFSNVGNAFQVIADGSNVLIDVGRAWFNSVWVYNDTLYPLPVQTAEVLLDRIDAVVIEINHTEAIRAGRIFFVQGTASADPQRPILTNTEDIHQYPLAYVYRKAGASTVTQADITNMIGTSSCPYVTGILATQDIDKVVAQWEAQFNRWFDELQVELSGDVAANLASQIIEIDARFEELAKTGCVYEDLQDSNNDTILDSQNRVIEGSTSFRQRSEDSPSGTGTSGDVNNLKMEIVKLDGRMTKAESNIKNSEDKIIRVGDIVTSSRIDDITSDKYLLCNGAEIDPDDYPELADAMLIVPAGDYTQVAIKGDTDRAYAPSTKVIYANGYYVFGGIDVNYAAAIWYSTSLSGPWTKKVVWEGYNSNRQPRVNDIIYANGYYVVVGSYQGNDSNHARLAYATNPTGAWTMRELWSSSDLFDDCSLNAVIYSDGYWIVGGTAVVGYETLSRARIAYSTSLGGSFTTRDLWTNNDSYSSGSINSCVINKIKRVNNYYVFLGQKGTGADTSRVVRPTFFYSTSFQSGGSRVDLSGTIGDSTITGLYDMVYVNGRYIIGAGPEVPVIWCSNTIGSGWQSRELTELSRQYESTDFIFGVKDILVVNDLLIIAGWSNKELAYMLKTCDPLTTAWTTAAISTFGNHGESQAFGGLSYENQNVIVTFSDADLYVSYLNMSKIFLPSISLSNQAYTYIRARS